MHLLLLVSMKTGCCWMLLEVKLEQQQHTLKTTTKKKNPGIAELRMLMAQSLLEKCAFFFCVCRCVGSGLLLGPASRTVSSASCALRRLYWG